MAALSNLPAVRRFYSNRQRKSKKRRQKPMCDFIQPWDKYKQHHARQMFRLTENPCYYCGDTQDSEKSVDHLIPQCEGGCHCADNLVSCCRSCNSKKGRKTPLQFKNNIRDRIQSLLFKAAMELEKSENYMGDNSTYSITKDLISGAWNLVDIMDINFPGEDSNGSEL